MTNISKVKIGLAGALLFLVSLIFIFDHIPYWRAKPPSSVTNVRSFFDWMPEPRGALRITVENKRYYQMTGPAGRVLASGPSAYTFDEQGQFIGWTPDMGDIHFPEMAFSPKARQEMISLDEMRMMMKTSFN